MIRITILIVASAAIAGANQIQVGGLNGLTSSYITSGCSGTTCVAGSISTATEQNYDTVLFAGVKNGASSPTPYSTYNQTAAKAGTITDPNGAGGAPVTFSMINDGVSSGGSNNFWSLAQNSGTAPTMTIPIGVFGVTDVWTMINLLQASDYTQNRDVTLFFNFGATPNATAVQTLMVKLKNGSNTTSQIGEVRNGVDCLPGTLTCQGVTNAASGPLANGPSTIASAAPYTVWNSSVYANNVYSFAGNGSQTLNLDDQGIFFNNVALNNLGVGDTNLNTYLVNIQVAEVGLAPDRASLGLSAITLDTRALFPAGPAPTVPEPSTVVLLLSGISGIGIGVIRRGKSRG